MQPGTNPDDLHTILSRFHTWAEKQPGQNNGKSARDLEGVRELTYEEALARGQTGPSIPRERRPRPAAKAASALPSAATPAIESGTAETPVERVTAMGGPNISDRREAVRPEKGLSAGLGDTAGAAPLAAMKRTRGPGARGNSTQTEAKEEKRVTKESPRAKQVRGGKSPEFRQVLAKSVRSANQSGTSRKAQPKKNSTPERTRRITTRFSTAEERRLEQAAAAAGMTVSAYLRKCALAAEPVDGAHTAPQARATGKRSAKTGPRAETQLFAQEAPPSFVGGWLALLRRRFLSSPQRFAERA